jgi:hypothetical protein
MKAIKDLLQEADPLRVESEPSAADRSFRRQAIVTAAATSALPATESRSRIPVYLSVILLAIVAFAVGSRLWSPSIGNVQAAVRFEVRLAEWKPAPGLREAKIAGTRDLIDLHDEVIVTNSDIAQAKVIPQANGSDFKIGVTLNPAGARKMHTFTENHIGKIAAILIDGEVVAAPVVTSPIAESAVIDGHLTKKEAEKIVAGMIIR